MKEAGNGKLKKKRHINSIQITKYLKLAAKKKMLDLYNQFKANTQKNNPQNQNENVATSSMPTTNAQYR
jgi:hypothetical protein